MNSFNKISYSHTRCDEKKKKNKKYPNDINPNKSSQVWISYFIQAFMSRLEFLVGVSVGLIEKLDTFSRLDDDARTIRFRK